MHLGRSSSLRQEDSGVPEASSQRRGCIGTRDPSYQWRSDLGHSAPSIQLEVWFEQFQEIHKGSPLQRGESSFVRRALLTKGPDSSFAEAHKGFNPEPTHIEDEVEDQEDEVEDGRDCEKCKERVEERSNTQAHDTWMV